jgi:hypothetical protein
MADRTQLILQKKKRSTEVLLFCKFARVTNFVHRSPMDTNRENIN